jgi:prophage regulatory protein
MYERLRDAPKPEQAPHADKELTPMSSRPIRLLRLRQVIDATGLGKTTIYALQAEGDFPMRVKITAHSVAWVEEEVQTWLAQRVEKSRSQSAPQSSVIPGQSPSRVSRKHAR